MHVCLCVADSLSEALKAISVSTELIEEELKPHLDTVLAALLEKSKSCTHTTHTYLSHIHPLCPNVLICLQFQNPCIDY